MATSKWETYFSTIYSVHVENLLVAKGDPSRNAQAQKYLDLAGRRANLDDAAFRQAFEELQAEDAPQHLVTKAMRDHAYRLACASCRVDPDPAYFHGKSGSTPI